MYMTASRIKMEGQPVLKLNIHDYDEKDIPFLDSLEINLINEESPRLRYIYIHSQENFHTTRAAILEKYTVLEEKGSKVFLERK